MKKLFVMAAMVLSSVGAFAQQAAGTTTIQPKVGLNVSTIADGDWKAGFAAGAELQYQATDKLGLAVGALYSAQGTKSDHVTWTPGLYQRTCNIELLCSSGSRSQGWYSARFHGR